MPTLAPSRETKLPMPPSAPEAKPLKIPAGMTEEDADPELAHDRDTDTPISTGQQKVIAQTVRRRYQYAQDAQWPMQLQAIVNWSYKNNNQWLDIVGAGTAGGRDSVNNVRNNKIAGYNYQTNNQMGWMIDANTARIVASWPSVGAAGLTQSPEDKASVEEADSVLTHINMTNCPRELQQDAANFMQCAGAAILTPRWDKLAYADLCIEINEQGEVTASDRAQVGDIELECINITELFADPKALEPKRCEWMIRARLASVNDTEKRFGVKVQGGPDGLTFLSFEQYKMIAAGDNAWQRFWSKQQCLLLEMWEAPTKQFKNGRVVITCREQVLSYTELPKSFRKAKQFHPFYFMWWRRVAGSMWGYPLANDLRPLQDQINRIESNIFNRAARDKPFLAMEENNHVIPGKGLATRLFEIVTFRQGGIPPKYEAQPQIAAPTLETVATIKKDMANLAGITDVLAALGKDIAQMSGAAIELVMDATQTRLTMPVHSFQTCVQGVMEVCLALWRDMATSLPRMLAIDTGANQSASSRMYRAEAFKRGVYRVVLTESTGLQRTPAEEMLDLQNDYDKGRFGPPQSPAANASYWELSDDIRYRPGTSRIIARQIAQQAAMPPPPDPAAIAAQKAQADAAAQEQANQQKLQLMQQEAQIDASAKQIEMQNQAAAQQQTIQAKATADANQTAFAHSLEISAQNNQAQIEFAKMKEQQVLAGTPKVSLTGALGPKGIPAAEELAGFPETDTEGDLKKAASDALAAKKAAPKAA